MSNNQLTVEFTGERSVRSITLVVDDTLAILEVMSAYLVKHGF